VKYINNLLLSSRHKGDEMEVATVLGPSVGRNSPPLVAAEYDIDNNTDSEDENYTEGMVNMLDFVSELQ
jgi:hypothetical protein